MKKVLAVYSLISFIAVFVGAIFVSIAPLPPSQTDAVLFAMAALMPTTILSLAMSERKRNM
ncbi:MAG: hypothetical protein V3V23_05345 [Dehalococcoidales bacterium]